jgi:hypothetical protein
MSEQLTDRGNWLLIDTDGHGYATDRADPLCQRQRRYPLD